MGNHSGEGLRRMNSEDGSDWGYGVHSRLSMENLEVRSTGSRGTGVTGGCVSADVGAGNHSQVLCNSSSSL